MLARLGRRDALAAGVADGLGVVVAGATTAAVLASAVAASSAGELDRVFVAALTLLALASFEGVAPLPVAARELSSTLGAGERVLEVADRTPAVHDPPSPRPVPAGTPALVLEGVSARYSAGDGLVLDGLELRLDPGRKVALVGPSGSGKTTVVNLLLRFLDPVAGRVTLGGHDLREYRQEDVRRALAVAGQDSYLFSSSIRENVRLARPDATDAEVDAALGKARIGDWVASLPDSAGTLVGEEGAQLSGGQRQRIALARALLSEAPVLILDEPTAHLDPETAQALVGDVLAAADRRSVLLITHRPDGLDLVDEVVSLAR
jgi:ATP-binding cassette, subfamily C, bacterial CydC